MEEIRLEAFQIGGGLDMQSKEFNRLYWRHYLIIEEDFIKTHRYVELDLDNFSTYSVEYTKLLQSIGSEFDVISKAVCRFYNVNNANNIYEYAPLLIENFINICSQQVIVKNNPSIIISPLNDWKLSPDYTSPKWWGSYNSIKHNRVLKYKEANLENIINGLASLYLVEMYFIYDIALKENSTLKIPEISSSLFEIIDWKAKQKLFADGLLFDGADDVEITRR